MSDATSKFEHVDNTAPLPQERTLYCVWRQASKENTKVYIHFVESSKIELDDLMFVDTPGFMGYAKLTDFVRQSDGRITDYMLKDAGVDFQTSMLLAKSSRNAIEKMMKEPAFDNTCVIVCLQQGISKGSR